MEYKPATEINYNIKDAAHCLRKDAFLPAHLKDLVKSVVIPDTYHPDLTITRGYAIQMIVSHISTELSNFENHPRTAIEKAVATFPTRVTPVSVSYGETEMEVRNSFMVPADEKLSSEVALKSHLADIVSYAYTPNSKSLKGSLIANFTESKPLVFPKIGHTKDSLDPWTEKSLDNSAGLFKLMSSNQDMLTLSDKITREIRNQPGMALAFMDLQLPKNAPIGTVKQGKRYTSVPSKFVPPEITTDNKTLDYAYQMMTISRRARGTDKDHISPLTTGYYWMTCTRQVNSLFCEASDILNVMIRSKKSILVHDFLSPNVASTLAANGMVVVKVVSTLVTSADAPVIVTAPNGIKTVQPGVYEVRSVSVLGQMPFLRYVKFGTEIQPNISKKGATVYSPDSLYDKVDTYMTNTKESVMFLAYACPRIFKIAKGKVYPSIRAHSGHVVITNFDMDFVPMTLEMQSQRMVSANMAKTWFPFSRYPFFVRDQTRFGIQFMPFMTDTGVILQNFVASSRKKSIAFEVTPAQPDKSLRPYMVDWGVTKLADLPEAPQIEAGPELVEAYGDDDDEDEAEEDEHDQEGEGDEEDEPDGDNTNWTKGVELNI